MGLLAYSPLAGGALSGKYISSNPDGARFNLFPGYMERYNKSLAKEAVALYCEVAAKHGMTPSELALAWCRSRWAGGGGIHGGALCEVVVAERWLALEMAAASRQPCSRLLHRLVLWWHVAQLLGHLHVLSVGVGVCQQEHSRACSVHVHVHCMP